ncbi:MarR family winged helix-turn-helix transcriptional regulator [Williamsia sp. SKLECPSW1]
MDAAEPRTAEDRLVDALAQTALTITSVLTAVAAAHDISLTQLRVFGILRDRTPRMAELAAYMGLERSTLTGLVDRAEDRGLLRRTRSTEDRRAMTVELTDRGRQLTVAVWDDVLAGLLPVYEHLDDDDRAALAGALERMLAPITL